MFVTTLVAASVAAQAAPPAQPTAAQPTAAPAPAAEKKMACCEKMAKAEGCDCCKDMDGKAKDAAPAHGEHGGHSH